MNFFDALPTIEITEHNLTKNGDSIIKESLKACLCEAFDLSNREFNQLYSQGSFYDSGLFGVWVRVSDEEPAEVWAAGGGEYFWTIVRKGKRVADVVRLLFV